MHLKSYTSISMLVKKRKNSCILHAQLESSHWLLWIFFFLGAVHSIGIWWKFQSVWHVIKLWAFLVLLVKIILENIVFHPYRYRPLLLSWHKPCEWYVHGVDYYILHHYFFVHFKNSSWFKYLFSTEHLSLSLSLSLYIYIYMYICICIWWQDYLLLFYSLYLAFEIWSL